MNPKMLDLQGGKVFEGALDGIAQKSEDVKKNIADATALYGRLEAMKLDCGKLAVEKAFNKLEASVSAVVAGNCASSRFCGSGRRDSLGDLVGAVDSLGAGPGLDVASVTSLSSGLSEVCTSQIVNPRNPEDGAGKGAVQVVESPPSPNCAKLAGPLLKDVQSVRDAQNRLGGGPAGSGR